MEDKIFDIAGKRFSGNALTSEEELILSEWLKTEGNELVFADLLKTWEISGKAKKQIETDVDFEWARFKSLAGNQVKTRTLNMRYVISIAASVIVLVGLFAVYRFAAFDKEIIIASTQNKTEILLPDNSKVWLNKNSTLSYHKKFGKKNRQINLEGEAFFEVQKSNVPFQIFSPGNIKTQVLGTSFNLRAYKNEPITELTVISGKVSFGKTNDANQPVFIKNQQAKLNTTTNSLETDTIKNQNALYWKTGIITFDNAQLSTVAEELSRYYGLKINIPENFKEQKFSGKFLNPSPAEIAEILGTSFSLTYTIKNETVIFNTTN